MGRQQGGGSLVPRLAGLIERVDGGLAHLEDEAGLALGDTVLLAPIK